MKLLNPLEQMLVNDGMKKGLEQGRARGAAELLALLLAQRFGPLPKTVRTRLAKASMAQVEAWGGALAQAQSLAQVFSASRQQ